MSTRTSLDRLVFRMISFSFSLQEPDVEERGAGRKEYRDGRGGGSCVECWAHLRAGRRLLWPLVLTIHFLLIS